MMPEIIAAIIGALVWAAFEFCFRIFAPKSWYFKIMKIEQRIRIRNHMYLIKTKKAYKIRDNSFNPVELSKCLEKSFKNVFSKFNVEIIVKEHEHNVSAILERSKLNIKIDAIILPKGDYPGEDYQVILKQNTKMKFKHIEKGLNALFWNLARLHEYNMNLITPVSDYIEIGVDAEGLKLFTELFKQVGVDVIGNKVSMHQEDEHTIIQIRDEFEIEFVEKLRDLVLLGHI